MLNNKTQSHLLIDIYNQNQNTQIQKGVIAKVVKGIEQKTYWYFTSGEAQFLGQIYEKQVDRQILKTRIKKITEDKMSEVLQEIISGKITKIKDEDHDELQVQLGIREIYDQLPRDQNSVAERGVERVKQINEDFRMFKDKMQQIKRRQQMKKRQKEILQEQFKKSLQNEKKQQHRQVINKKLEDLKKNHQSRQQSGEKFKIFLREYKKTKPKYVLIEEEYKERIQLPAIQESRKKLQMLTHRKKPTLEEINDHDKLYMEQKSNRPEKIIQSQTIDVSFKSHFYQREEERLKQREQYEENGPSWDYLEKQKRYSQFVKDKVKPKVSQKLRQSLEENITKIHSQVQSPDRSKYIEVGKNYLQFMRNLQKKRKVATPNKPLNDALKESRYINYLEQLKAKSQHTHSSSMDWERDMKDRTTSKLEKRERVLMKSKQLEEKAMRDEKIISHYNYGRAEQIINKKKEIDETLLSSIKAKVAVLKNARQP